MKLVFALLLTLGVGAAVADSLGTIRGSVATNGTPARVTITCGKVTKTTMTDPAGNFSIGGLPAGACTVTASASGYSAAAASVTVAGGRMASVSLSLRATPTPKVDTKKMEAPAEEPAPVVAPSPSMPHANKPPARYRVVGGKAPVAPPPPGQPLVLDNDPAHNTEAYDKIDDNPFFKVSQRPLSTFSVDVDTASYANTRRFLADGKLPPKDAVRIEEMINYFSYDYPQPAKGEPFSITTDVTQSPFNAKLKLVRVGLKAPAIEDSQVPARNLVFLIDVSGSMTDANKLPLLKQAMNLLVAQMRQQDKISIVTYAGNAGLVLPPTSGKEKDTIRNAINNLEPGGSTNGAAGIQLAYDLAEKQKSKAGINRVILATDGDFNVGTTDQGSLIRLIEQRREKGVFLTVLGFGMGNYKDSTLEKLADKGNGNHAYIDTIAEARKVLVKEAGATLVTVAKDVKLQIEFNPTTVAGYRLIGYENRLLKDEDFNDDKKDAGDIGAGHSVTALYEIVPAGTSVPGAGKVDDLKYQSKTIPNANATTGELMTVKIRYKQPDGKTSKLLSRSVANQTVELAKTSADLRWATAIAGFGMLLRDSPHRGNLSWKQVQTMAEGAVGTDADGYRAQAIALIKRASTATR
ncbi:MAG: von Willebrand factor type A domain-containing protein [Kofleriaceae bacterium]